MSFLCFVEFTEHAMPRMWRLVADNWHDAEIEALCMLDELDGAYLARIVDQDMKVRTLTPAKDGGAAGRWTAH
jgi:hypothetical protein